MNEEQFNSTIEDLARQVVEQTKPNDDLVLVGIRTRGVELAILLKDALQVNHNRDVPLGVLDITLYRDDLSQLASQPLVQPSELPFDISGKTIILVDDVLYTGRTIRAALDQLVDFGRPQAVRLLVMVDRGWREYPIQPDFAGAQIETTDKEIVHVRVTNIDGEQDVIIVTR
jgi:pyrimidine operon attenuation protein/uracil phosphoribosyltransferase